MSSEGEKKNVEEKTENNVSSAEEENEKEENAKEEKANSKPAAKKKTTDPPKIKQPAKKRVKTEQVEKEDKVEEKKKPETEEEDGDDESEDEDNAENHKAVPLLDQPLEITGSRKRKEVQRFKPIQPEEDSKELKVPEGKGVALGEIERIDFNIQRAKVEDLKLLHRLCFGKVGKAATLKKTVKKFNGFGFDVSSEEYGKKKSYIEKNYKKVTVGNLKSICQIVDLERGGTKEDLWDRLLQFLTCPVDSGKKLPGSGRSKRSGASSKNYDEGEDSFKSKKKGKSKKKDDESDESENEDKDLSDEEEVNNDKADKAQTTEESEPEKEEELEKPKKAGKKGKKGGEAADKKAPPKKRAAAKKVAESEEDGENESDNDDEPLVKKSKTPPTDEEIKTYVKSLLEGANLELITMKKVCQDVYAHYPDFDLGHKKDFIKSTVKSLISS